MTRAAAVSLLLLLASFAAADEEAAAFFTARGAEALAKGDLKEAQAQFEKALGNHAGYFPARLGLAKTARAGGKTDDALRQLEAILDAAEGKTLDPASSAALKEARNLLGEMDKPRLEYRDAVSEYVSKLLALARRSEDANPELARRCVDRILAVCPDHPGALLLKAAIPASVLAPKPKANEEPLFNGKDLQGFADHAPIFSVKKGVVVAEAVNGSWLLRTERVLKGDYSVEYEARVLQDAGDKPCLALGFGFRKEERTYQIEVHVDYLLFRIRDFATDQTQKFGRIDFYRLKTPLDRTKWNVFRVDVRDNVATVSVNGESFASNPASPGTYDGQAMIMAQDAVGEVRRIALVH
jgi:tetratricopeptide (TPR) repeat protein